MRRVVTYGSNAKKKKLGHSISQNTCSKLEKNQKFFMCKTFVLFKRNFFYKIYAWKEGIEDIRKFQKWHFCWKLQKFCTCRSSYKLLQEYYDLPEISSSIISSHCTMNIFGSKIGNSTKSNFEKWKCPKSIFNKKNY